ncbi:MAG: hypothetical protein QGG73_10645, partial [Candidatus Hydrogenedentes bacterium]|nr:hypothetical protein [Candidatus Hydrogenedentota bacterium]
VTKKGRSIIKSMIKWLEGKDCKVIEIDTDGIYFVPSAGIKKKKDEEERKEQEKKFETLLECLQKKLDEVVKEVRISNRLHTSAACLVGDEDDLSPQLEEMMKSMGQDMPKTKRILEVNPGHPVVEKLQAIFEGDQKASELADHAELLYGQALLAEGGQLADPGKFAKLVADVMAKAL